MSFARTVLSVLATQSVVTPIALVTHVLLARLLSVHDRGLFAVATELAVVAATLVQLGWPAASIYQLRSRGVAPAVVAGGTLVLWGLASLAAGAGALLLEGILRERLFAGASPTLYHVAVALVPFQLLGFLLTGVARGIGRFDLHNAYRFGLTAGTLIVLALVFGLGPRTALAALLGLLVVQVAVSISLAVTVLRQTGVRIGASLASLADTLRFGLKTHAQHLLLNIHQQIDIFMIAYLLGSPELVGLYAVAAGVTNWTRTIPMSIALTLFPTLAGLGEREAARFVARVSRHSAFWMLLSVALLLPASSLLVTGIFGERYAGSVPPLLLLMPAMAILTVYMLLARYFTSRNRQQVNIVTQAVATGANVLLNLWWIPRYGILGAAAASLCSYTLQSVIMLFAFVRESGIGPLEVLCMRREDWAVYPRRLRAWARGSG